MTRSVASIALGVALAAAVPSAPALEADLRVGAMRFGYEERDSAGNRLNREEGYLGGLELELSRDVGPVALEAHGAGYGGTVDYDGFAQDLTSGSVTPFTTETDERLWRAGLGIAGQGRLAPYVRVTRHWWERDIRSRRGVSGPYELYRWWEPALGVRWSSSPEPGGLEVDAAIFRVTGPELEAEVSGFDTLSLDLGEENGYRARLGYAWPAGEVRTVLGLFVEAWEFGRSGDRAATSGGLPTGLVFHEPASETLHWGITLGVRRPW